MLKLIVFDCDGVMFNSKMANTMYYNHLLAHFALDPMNEAEQDFIHMSNVHDSIEYIFRHYDSPTLDEVHSYRKECGYGPFLQYMEMEPDLIEFLDITCDTYHLAISTNRTDTMVPLLKQYNLDKYFGKVMTASNAARPKPAPDALLEILAYYQCQAEEAIYIGDSIIDELHAASCNVELIAFKSPKLRAAYHVSSFMEILHLPPFLAR
ncbi:MAG: HAD family hydrolase [Desulforhopalus sp.]